MAVQQHQQWAKEVMLETSKKKPVNCRTKLAPNQFFHRVKNAEDNAIHT